MADLRELYQQVILDHNKAPRNFGKLAHSDHDAEGHNPLCGDHIVIHLAMDGDRIREIGFEGSGCAISKASASLMTQALKGKTRAEAEAFFDRFHRMVTAPATEEVGDLEPLGKLAVFSGVREYPMRVKCAILAWHTMIAALKGEAKPVSTE